MVCTETWIKESRSMAADICKKRGNLLRAAAARNGRVLADSCFDRYEIQIGDSINENCDESEDRVDAMCETEDTIRLDCSNPLFERHGLRISKSYMFLDDCLAKRLEITNSGSADVVIRWHSVTRLDSMFREQGRYYTPWQNGRGVLSEDITDSQKQVGMNQVNIDTLNPGLWDHRVVAFVNRESRVGLGHFRYRVNDKFSYFLAQMESTTLTYTEDGWSFGVVAQYLKPGESFSAEVRWMCFRDDHSRFIRAYFALPEIESIRNYESPKWLHDVKMVGFIHPSGMMHRAFTRVKWTPPPGEEESAVPPAGIALLEAMEGRLRGGTAMIPFYHWPYDAEWGYSPTDRHEDKELARGLKLLRERAPSMKTAVYTVDCLLDMDTPLYAEHPDWVIGSRDGGIEGYELMKQITGLDLGYVQMVNDDCRRYYLENAESIMKIMEPDWYYIDLSGTGIEAVDWRIGTSATWWDWQEFYRSVRDIARSINPDAALMLNFPNAVPADCSFIELPLAWWEPRQSGMDWHLLADILEFAKIAEKPGRWNCPLYWRNDVDLHTQPEMDRNYAHAILQFGFKPNYPAWVDFRSFAIRVPYIDAAFQLRDLQILDADIEPYWRRQDTPIEAYALIQGQFGWVPVVNRGESVERVTVSVQRGPLGLEPHEPVWRWLLEVVDPSSRSAAADPVIKVMALDRDMSNGARIAADLELGPDVMQVLVLTQSPGIVKSVDGIELAIPLPSTMGVQMCGKVDSKNRRVQCRVGSDAKECEVAILWPFDEGLRCSVDGVADSSYSSATLGGYCSVVVKLSAGEHCIEMSAI